MTDEQTGLPADFVKFDGTRSTPTSPTNIGAYLWSAVSAERLGIIGHRETVARLGRTLSTLERMERARRRPVLQLVRHPHRRDLAASPGGDPVTPMAVVGRQRAGSRSGCASSRAGCPSCARGRSALFDSMDFDFYYDAGRNQILFHYETETDKRVCCYDTIVSESRIASYVGIEKGELPARQYYGALRAFPDKCDIARDQAARRHAHLPRRVACSRARSRTRACG